MKWQDNVVNLSGPHDWYEWIFNNIDHWQVCKNCQAQSENANHIYGGGVITKPATTTAEGEKTYTCTVCKFEKTEKISKLPYTPSVGIPSVVIPSDGNPSDSTPIDSDSSESEPTESGDTPYESSNPSDSNSESSSDENSSTDESNFTSSEISPPISDNPATGIAITVVQLVLAISAITVSAKHGKK